MIMPVLALRPVPLTPRRLADLERRGLVRQLLPTKRALSTRTKTGAVDRLYRSSRDAGAHQLICIGKRSTEIKLVVHRDNEEFILLKPRRLACRPLFLVVGLMSTPALEKKARAGTLERADFLAFRLIYNDPRTCVFSMLKGVPHCEVTSPGPGQHPVFFVSEPARLGSRLVRLGGVRLEVSQ